MKLLYIANVRLPTEKAHGIQIMEMCHAFAMQGAEVELIVPRRLNPIKEDPFLYYGIEKNFRIRFLPTLDLIHFGKYGFFLQVLSFALCTTVYALFTRRFDAVYTRDEYSATLLTRWFQNVFLEIHIARHSAHFFQTASLCKGVVVISSGLARHLTENGVLAEKILTVHDGVDLDKFTVTKSGDELRRDLGLPARKKIIGYVGKMTTMGEDKGVGQLIRAFALACHEYDDLHLLLVGANSDERSMLFSMFTALKISTEKYSIVEHIPHSRVPLYLKASDVLVMNYPNTDHYAHVMSPLKLFEYMASGTPIVSSDLPSVREILDESEAFFVEPENEQALSIVLLEALNDMGPSIERAQRAFEKVKGYSWERRAGRILSFMER